MVSAREKKVSSAPVRVAFIFAHQDQQWLGGIHYLKNLLRALHELPERRIEPVVVHGTKVKSELMAGFPQGLRLSTPLLDRKSFPWIVRKGLAKLLGKDVLLEQFLRSHGIKALSHSDDLGRKSGFPCLGWIPDFQHRKLEGFFSPETRAFRDRYFLRLAKHCRRVFLSSQNAKEDMGVFLSGFESKGRVLRFVDVSTPDFRPVLERSALESKYGFQGPYLHLPNQFWMHKNHGVVLDALSLLKRRGREILVVATGNPVDNRNPGYFPSLERRIQELGIHSNIRILGLVPYEDLVSLMSHAHGMLNPSFFEGWSTSVEEAKSLGKIMILSNIPVHLEQNPAGGLYFDPRQPEQLAAQMEKVIFQHSSLNSEELRSQAIASFAQRKKDFGLAYEEIVLEALQR